MDCEYCITYSLVSSLYGVPIEGSHRDGKSHPPPHCIGDDAVIQPSTSAWPQPPEDRPQARRKKDYPGWWCSSRMSSSPMPPRHAHWDPRCSICTCCVHLPHRSPETGITFDVHYQTVHEASPHLPYPNTVRRQASSSV